MGIYGLPGLSAKDQTQVELGNATMRASVRLIEACAQQGCPVFLENPITSMLWFVPEVQALRKHLRYCDLTCDYCQFGERWRKRTRFAAWCAPMWPALSKRCKSKGGRCTRTKLLHVQLSGVAKAPKGSKRGRVYLTRLAEAYPVAVAKQIAAWMVAAAAA